jgi:hypothetical protein
MTRIRKQILIRVFYVNPWVVHQFEITPKAFANFSPGLERSDNPGIRTSDTHGTLTGFRLTLSGFRRKIKLCPRVLAMLEPWAGVSQRLRRISN